MTHLVGTMTKFRIIAAHTSNGTLRRQPTRDLGLVMARVLAALLIANFLTLVTLNLFQSTVLATVPVFLLSTLVAAFLMTKVRWRRVTIAPDRWTWIFVAAGVVLLALPRVAYLLEWLPGNTVVAFLDDYARIPEIASMVMSPAYPLRHPANPEYLLSFYYTALYPIAALKVIVPLATIKDCIAIGNLLYHVLSLGAIAGVARVVTRDGVRARILVFMVALFGGLDWIMSRPTRPIGHSEWWQTRFDSVTQISSFYISHLYAIHHVAGFLSVLLAWFILVYARLPNRQLKAWIVLLLLAAAFYCSPFSVMAVPFFAIVHARMILRRLLLTRAAAGVFLLALVPMYVFLNKPAAIGFTSVGFRVVETGSMLLDRLLSLPVYVSLVPLVEFGGVPILLIAGWSHLRSIEKRYWRAAAGFFVLTFFVGFIGANDFCMRGMLLPSFVFYGIFALRVGEILAAWRRPVSRAVAIGCLTMAGLGVLGTLKEAVTGVYAGMYRSVLAWRLIGRDDLPAGLKGLHDMNARNVARDPRVTTILYDDVKHLGYDMYSLEKMIDRKPFAEMKRGELELLRYPRNGFFW